MKSYVGDGHYRVNIGVGAATIDAHESKLTAVADLPAGSLSTGRAESSSTSTELDTELARLALSGNVDSPGATPGSSSAPMRSPFTPRSSALRSPRAAAHMDSSGTSVGSPAGDAADGPLSLSRASSRVSVVSHALTHASPRHTDGGTPTAAAPAPSALSSSSGPELALITALRRSLGPGFKLQPSLFPDPKFKQDYHLKFGPTRQFWFQQVDYGVKFEPFLGLDYVADPEVVTSCPSALENFRCMFLHLGVGIEVHPFVLQVPFRPAPCFIGPLAH